MYVVLFFEFSHLSLYAVPGLNHRAEYEGGAQRITSAPFDFLTLGDIQAVRTRHSSGNPCCEARRAGSYP